MRRSIIIFLLAIATTAMAQELNCRVTINSSQIEGSNKQVFETLKQSIEEYLNQTKWTNQPYAANEKIDCSLMLLVNTATDNMFKCAATIQSRRPVYGTTYTTPILNIQDNDFNFSYQEYDRLDYQTETFTSNLAAMLAFYAYLIIGEDGDTFSRMGGQPYYQACQQIAQLCQTASMESTEQSGWKAFGSNRNRYALVSNLTDEAFRDYRDYVYTYHRLGLDKMADNVANGRKKIADGIEVLKTAYRARPATYVVNTFMDAKADEIVDIFAKAPADEKKVVYEIVTNIDPTRQTTYDKMNQ